MWSVCSIFLGTASRITSYSDYFRHISIFCTCCGQQYYLSSPHCIFQVFSFVHGDLFCFEVRHLYASHASNIDLLSFKIKRIPLIDIHFSKWYLLERSKHIVSQQLLFVTEVLHILQQGKSYARKRHDCTSRENVLGESKNSWSTFPIIVCIGMNLPRLRFDM